MLLKAQGCKTTIFLSTPSARRATTISGQIEAAEQFLSTPSARRATAQLRTGHVLHGISIHALREEGDARVLAVWLVPLISIHALREEGDQPGRVERGAVGNFYPRPPRGGRRRLDGAHSRFHLFLSTPSARRATNFPGGMSSDTADFYPRPPRGGRQQKQRQNLYFQTNCTTFCTNLEEP